MRSTPASKRRTGDSPEAEVWLHVVKPITAGLIDAPRLKLMRRLRDGAPLRFRVFDDAVQALKSASFDAIFECRRKGNKRMRTTVTLDDDLLRDAEFYTGIREKSALIREALRALVQREAARRLARLGGTEPRLRAVPRRRAKS